MKKLLFSFAFLSMSFVFAQKIKFKGDKVLVDDKELFKTEKIGTFGASGYNLFELNGQKPIIALISNNGGTHMELSDDYTQIKFLTKGLRAEIDGGDLRNAIKMLLQNDIIDNKGVLDESKVELFIQNYDEKISDKTVRYR